MRYPHSQHRIQVEGSRRSSWRKLQADDSFVTEMASVHLFHTTGNVRCTVTGQRYPSLVKQSIFPAIKARLCDKTTVFMQFYAEWWSSTYRPLRETTSPPPFWWRKNPCDFWLWGNLKFMVYRNPITSLSVIEESIERHVRINPQFMQFYVSRW